MEEKTQHAREASLSSQEGWEDAVEEQDSDADEVKDDVEETQEAQLAPSPLLPPYSSPLSASTPAFIPSTSPSPAIHLETSLSHTPRDPSAPYSPEFPINAYEQESPALLRYLLDVAVDENRQFGALVVVLQKERDEAVSSVEELKRETHDLAKQVEERMERCNWLEQNSTAFFNRVKDLAATKVRMDNALKQEKAARSAAEGKATEAEKAAATVRNLLVVERKERQLVQARMDEMRREQREPTTRRARRDEAARERIEELKEEGRKLSKELAGEKERSSALAQRVEYLEKERAQERRARLTPLIQSSLSRRPSLLDLRTSRPDSALSLSTDDDTGIAFDTPSVNSAERLLRRVHVRVVEAISSV